MTASSPPDPSAAGAASQQAVRTEYERRRDAAHEAVAECRKGEERLANGRMLAFAAGLVLLWPIFAVDGFSGLWLVAPLAVFGWLVVRHTGLQRVRQGHERRARLYEHGLLRLDGGWAGIGHDGADHLRKDHPYAEHLDVFGAGSLYQYLCRARTSHGRDALARWLGQAGLPDDIRRRQAAIAELRPRIDLREDVALLGADSGEAAQLARLPAWGEAPRVLASGALRIAAVALATITVGVLIGCFVADLSLGRGLLVMLPCFAAEWLFWRFVRERVALVLAAAESGAKDLEVVAGLLERLERESVQAPLLRDLADELATDGEAASVRIAALRKLIDGLEAQSNQFFAPFAAMLLWPVHFAFGIERWRERSGPAMTHWFAAMGQLEALLSLSGYAYEHPADPFPEIVEDGLVLEGHGLGHPLLPESRHVRNDLEMDVGHRVYIVSGSNMSGKSTYLRTVGTNVVMALAGAPVRAESLRISPVAVGASIHVHDSLLDGESRFYAEVSRIGQIVQIGVGTGLPLFFLLDELFHGTNSSDRRVGAAAVVRTLLESGAMGLLTTHDLELARLAEDLGDAVVNVHFEDRFEDGKMSFDYRCRPGVVERSNALALMRAVGLDV